MAAKRKRQCCRIKDHSPLGLLGIFLITAGVIIAIYDAKDALPYNTEPYVIAIGVILIALGVTSIVLAFMGYRRSRAVARKNMGGKEDGHGRRRNLPSKFEAMEFPPKHVLQPLNNNEKTNNTGGPALVALPGCYKVVLPTESEHYISRIGGYDNCAFQQNPSKVSSCEFLNNSQQTWERGMKNCSPGRSGRTGQTHSHRIHVIEDSRNEGVTYSPRVTEWSSTEVAQYIPPKRKGSHCVGCYLCVSGIICPVFGMGVLFTGVCFVINYYYFGPVIMVPGLVTDIDNLKLGYCLIAVGTAACIVGIILCFAYYTDCLKRHNRVHCMNAKLVPTLVLQTADLKGGYSGTMFHAIEVSPRQHHTTRRLRYQHRKLHHWLDPHPEYPIESPVFLSVPKEVVWKKPLLVQSIS